LKSFPDIDPKSEKVLFVPRIFGFKLYQKEGSQFKKEVLVVKDEN